MKNNQDNQPRHNNTLYNPETNTSDKLKVLHNTTTSKVTLDNQITNTVTKTDASNNVNNTVTSLVKNTTTDTVTKVDETSLLYKIVSSPFKLVGAIIHSPVDVYNYMKGSKVIEKLEEEISEEIRVLEKEASDFYDKEKICKK